MLVNFYNAAHIGLQTIDSREVTVGMSRVRVGQDGNLNIERGEELTGLKAQRDGVVVAMP